MRRRARAAIDAQADALDAFVIEGIRHNIPFLVGADGASALASRQAVDRLHRRGISRTASRSARPKARARRMLGGGRGGDRSHARRAQAADFRPAHRPRGDARERRAACGSMRRNTRSRSSTSAVSSATLAPNGGELRSRCATPAGRTDHARPRTWKPGEPVWSGTVNGKPVAVQVRPVPNGFQLSWRGAQAQSARLHRAARPTMRG